MTPCGNFHSKRRVASAVRGKVNCFGDIYLVAEVCTGNEQNEVFHRAISFPVEGALLATQQFFTAKWVTMPACNSAANTRLPRRVSVGT